MTVRLLAIGWAPDRLFRFQAAIPAGAPPSVVDELKRATYSLRPMTAAEKATVHPLRLRIVTAAAGDTAASLAARMAVPADREAIFRMLNGLKPGETVQAGRRYKVVTNSN